MNFNDSVNNSSLQHENKTNTEYKALDVSKNDLMLLSEIHDSSNVGREVKEVNLGIIESEPYNTNPSNNNNNEDKTEEDEYDDNHYKSEENTLKLQNKELNDQIILLSSKVGEYIENIKDNLKKKDKPIQSTLEHLKEDFQSFNKVNKEILYYKNNIIKIKSQLETIYNHNKIEQLENELKHKRDKLNQLKVEESILESIKKNHNKTIKELEDKYQNKEELDLIRMKIKSNKDEIRMKKDLLKGQELKLKDINNNIYNVDNKIKLFKDKIEIFKTQNLDVNKNINEDQISIIEKEILESESIISNQDKLYKMEFMQQKNNYNKLLEENKLIETELKDRTRSAKMNEFKNKENLRNMKSNNNIIKKESSEIFKQNNKEIINNHIVKKQIPKITDVRALSAKYNLAKTDSNVDYIKNLPAISKLKDVSKAKIKYKKSPNDKKDSEKVIFPTTSQTATRQENKIPIKINKEKSKAKLATLNTETDKFNDTKKTNSIKNDNNLEENMTNTERKRIEWYDRIEKLKNEVQELIKQNES